MGKRTIVVVCLLVGAVDVLAEDFVDADLSLRYRYELVDDDAFADDAHASTLRSRLSLEFGPLVDLSFRIEIDDVRELGAGEFNAGAGNTPGRTQYPVVADPDGTEINQIYVGYSGFDNTTVRIGTQRINLDNQRFVGGVAWRQNEQTFDAATIRIDAERVKGFFAYLDKVRRIFGEDVPAGKHSLQGSSLLHLSTGIGAWSTLSGYHYRIDNEDAPAFSTSTSGARLSGKRKVDETTYSVTVELARQSDAPNNPVDFDAYYSRLDLGFIFDRLELGVGWEVLSGDEDKPGEAFRTPLATLHAFNGLADKFLTTPTAGLDDKLFKVKTAPGPWLLEARYHHFSAADGGDTFGEEIDLRAGYKLSQRLRGDVFLAAFDGRDGLSDTFKFWVMLTATL